MCGNGDASALLGFTPSPMKLPLLRAGLLLALALPACTKETDPGGVFLRVRNTSPVPLTGLVVRLPAGTHRYGALGPGQTSEYNPFAQAYRYATVEATAANEDLRFQPYDYVGEKPLAPGRYTYVLDVEANASGQDRRLSLRLENP